jgi:hypothetical protein
VTVEIQYRYTENDYVQAQRAYLAKRWYKLYIPAFLAVALVFIGLGIWSTVGVSLSYGIAWFVGAAFFAIFPVLQAEQAKKDFRGSPSAEGEFRLSFDDNGLQLQSPHGGGTVKWSALVGWIDSPDLFLVLASSRIYYLFPKRAFTPEQLAEFRDLLARKIPQTK